MKASAMFPCFFHWPSNKHVSFPNYCKQLYPLAAHKNIFTVFERFVMKVRQL